MARKGGLTAGAKMSVMGHVQELQKRLVVSAIFLITGASLAYAFRDELIRLLMDPLKGQSLMYLNPAGGFSFILLVSVYAGLALAAPVTIYQIFCFIRPILSKRAQNNSLFVLVSSMLLLAGGVAFGYIFAIPGALNFLYGFADKYVQASLTADSYLNFVIAYTLGLGLVFQLPIVLMLIHWINPLTPSMLLKSERWVVLVAFLAAALITPTPDPLNQTIIALPIVVVYQLGVVAVLVSVAREKRNLARNRKRQIPALKPVAPLPVITHAPVDLVRPAEKRLTPTVSGIVRPDTAANRPVPVTTKQPAKAPIQRAAIRGGQVSIDGFISPKETTRRPRPSVVQQRRAPEPRLPRPSYYPTRTLVTNPRSQLSNTVANEKYIDGLSRVAAA